MEYDPVFDGDCVYYTVQAWNPPGTEQSCATNNYFLDGFDRYNPNIIGYSNAQIENKFMLPGLSYALAPGEVFCDFQ